MAEVDLSHALEIARRAAAAADAAALPFFERGVLVETKPDRSPVTEADRASEQAILSVITEAFPTHSILAEESGTIEGDPGCRWIIDPIDGTRGFTRGGQFWGSLIALEVDGDVEVGTLSLPALGETYFAARGHGCFVNDRHLKIDPAERPLQDATLSVGELRALLRDPWGPVVRALIAEAASTRCYGDVMGVALVLQGVADIWLEAGVQAWDLAPASILVSEAGGVLTSFRGDTDLSLGNAVAAAPGLHREVLRRLHEATPHTA